ncbi:hypothetical protein M272_05345 [Vibrio natriegens NBRC 15636 = ATCC 14048 = DSM 759]|nr:hypothetical protein M272_05345 [Vibrio natriegens NBRC 15636 = ATCC 14048 = DSM 759]
MGVQKLFELYRTIIKAIKKAPNGAFYLSLIHC